MAFGPDGPGRDGTITDRYDLFKWLFRGYPNLRRYSGPLRGYQQPADRSGTGGRSALVEHVELLYARGDDIWHATRLGLTTPANGKDAVRQRIKDRTGL